MAKAAYWALTDAEARKRGEQTGLDTLVAVSYTHLRSADRKLPAAHAYADDIKWQSFFSSYNRIELFLHIFSQMCIRDRCYPVY